MKIKDDSASAASFLPSSFHPFIFIPARGGGRVSGGSSPGSTQQLRYSAHNMAPVDQTVSAQFEKLPVPVKLLTAGASACFADFASFPLDTAKVRLQVQGEVKVKLPTTSVPLTSATQNVILGVHQSPVSAAPASQLHYRGIFGTMATITREEGFRCLYNGLNAGLQRQMCFASIRLGLYEPVKAKYQTLLKVTDQNRGGSLDVIARICAGLTTGGTAVMCAQPTDVVKIRFQAQAKAVAGEATGTVRYTGTWQAYRSIYFTEGLAGLWKGTIPNIGRNAIVNVAEIVVYDLVKDTFLRHKVMGDNIACHFSSAVVAGLVATFVASPVDVIKTRYMNSAPGTYRGAIHCAVETFGREGVPAFYKGFLPSFTRITMWNILMWVTYEQAKRAVIQHYPREE